MPVSATYGWPTVGSSWDAAVFAAVNDASNPPTANSETIAVSGFGVQTGTAPASGAGIRYFRLVTTGYTTYLDQMTTVVAKRSASAVQFGCCTRTSNTTQTYYVAQTASAQDTNATYYYGLRLLSVSSGTRTQLIDVSTTNTSMSDLATTSNSFVLQYRVFSVNGGTQTLHQARIWTGSDPLSPPSGAVWTIGTVSASNYYSVGYVENAAGLATGRSGIWTSRPSASGAATTVTFSSYEYRNLSDYSAASVTAFGVAQPLTAPARYIGAALTNASSLLRGTVGLVVPAGASLTASSTVLGGSATRVAVTGAALTNTSGASGSAQVVALAQAALQGASGGTGSAVRVRLADGAMSGAGAATATASVRMAAAATATGTGTLTGTVVVISGTGAAAVLAGSGSLTATVRATVVAQSSCSGAGSVTATATRSTFGTAYLVGTGILTGQSSMVRSAAAAINGSGTMAGSAINIFPPPTEVRETYTRKVGTGLAATAAARSASI